MCDTARIIVESSLSATLSRKERRLALARRMYGNELPEAALIEFAEWKVAKPCRRPPRQLGPMR